MRRTLEEIHLLKCSLLPGEVLVFLSDASQWDSLVEQYSVDPDLELDEKQLTPAHFQVKLESSSDIYFDVEFLPGDGGSDARNMPTVSVKGDHLGRAEQERWQGIVATALSDVQDSEYPTYELISAHLLPELHTALDHTAASSPPPQLNPAPSSSSSEPAVPYHALFVSHHLKSPHKRRSLAQWAHELSLAGFAKVGHPGVIYCEGVQPDVEDFVDRVKGMQWLALRLRFIEPAPSSIGQRDSGQRRLWAEFEKVGEVVEEMRRMGRESFVVEMGIGSAANFNFTRRQEHSGRWFMDR